MNKLKVYRILELLAIIIIPLIFVLFTIPRVALIIREYREITFLSDVKKIAEVAEYINLENKLLNIDNIITCDDIINDSSDYKSCSVYMDNNTALVSLEGQNKYMGMKVCSGSRLYAAFSETCDDICIMNDLVEVKNPYEINDYESCMTYTEDFFINKKGYTNNELKAFCKGGEVNGWSFSDNIEYMINNDYTEQELIENNVIIGKIHDICIPNKVHVTCYEYDILGEKGHKYAEITNYDDRCGSNIVIPDRIDGLKVEGIKEGAFSNSSINNVKFSSNLKYISNNAFRGSGAENTSNKGIRLTGTLDMSDATNLESIASFAFADNKITKVIFPDNLKAIGSYAFSENKISGELDLSNTKLTSISEYAFSSNEITNIKLPEKISYIGFTSFAGNEIKELDLSNYNYLTKISAEAFSLNKIEILKLPINIMAIDKDAFSYNLLSNELDLSPYINLKEINGFRKNLITSVKLPINTEIISSYAFANNSIQSIDLSENINLTDIQESAFSNNNLTNIVLPLSIKTIEKNAFYKSNESNKELNSITNLSDNKFDWNIITGSNEENCLFEKGKCGTINIVNK